MCRWLLGEAPRYATWDVVLGDAIKGALRMQGCSERWLVAWGFNYTSCIKTYVGLSLFVGQPPISFILDANLRQKLPYWTPLFDLLVHVPALIRSSASPRSIPNLAPPLNHALCLWGLSETLFAFCIWRFRMVVDYVMIMDYLSYRPILLSISSPFLTWT